MKEIQLEEILVQKHEMVSRLLNQFRVAEKGEKYKWSRLLIENFRDERIVPTIMEVALSAEARHYNATLLFYCEEYGGDQPKQYINELIEVVINGEYEASMAAMSLIHSFLPPYPWSDNDIDAIESKLKRALLEAPDDNRGHIESLLNAIG